MKIPISVVVHTVELTKYNLVEAIGRDHVDSHSFCTANSRKVIK